MKLIKMNSISQIKQTLRDISNAYFFKGINENGEPIFDNKVVLPTITAKGTVKLHGTNAGINFDLGTGEIKPQKKSNFVTVEKDNYRFAFWFENNKEKIVKLLNDNIIEKDYNIYNPYNSVEFMFNESNIIVYGEWAGKGVLKGVGISKFDKAFYIFGVKIVGTIETEDGEKEVSFWLPNSFLKSIGNELMKPELGIYNIHSFKTFEIEIDLNVPEKAMKEIYKIVKEVEEKDPVVEKLCDIHNININDLSTTIGEGIVVQLPKKDGTFTYAKVKGEKHSRSKVKKFKKVDSELENKKRELAEKVTPSWRLNQGLQEVFGENWKQDMNIKRIGEYLKWIIKDIIKEELSIIEEAGFDLKQIQKYIVQRAKEHFIAELY